MPKLPRNQPSERLLGVDFGEKRVGVAIWDPDVSLALPHTVLSRRSDEQVIEQLAGIVHREEIARIVVGDPRGPEGASGSASRRVHSFARKLRATLGATVDLVDETLTSKEAAWRLRAIGANRKRRNPPLDAIAAQVLLEDYVTRDPLVNADPGQPESSG